VPVEAQACGAPIIARAVGGILDSVVDGETGLLYTGDGVSDLASALREFEPSRYESGAIRNEALKFAPERFRTGFLAAIRAVVGS
jgi:glycosyltransferase involved in cell wall biosynthesis